MDILLNSGLFILFASLLEYIGYLYFFDRWKSRDMKMPQLDNKLYSIPAILLSFSSGILFYIWYRQTIVGLSFTIFFWLVYIVFITDLKYKKIPSGACWLVFLLNSVFILYYSLTHKTYILIISVGITILSVLIAAGIIALTSKGKFGLGDVRLMLVLASLASWVGYMPILSGIALASIIQFPLRFFLRKFREYDGVELPFGPALIIGTLISIIIFSHPGITCSEFGVIANC